MNSFIQKIRIVFADKNLRKRILFVLGALAVFRILATIPVPGIDHGRLEELFTNNQFLGLLDIFSGGGLSNLSIVMLGVGPYITASIIMQLLTIMIPRIKEMYQEEGEAGRRKFAQWSRLLTPPLALIQALAFTALLGRQGVLVNLSSFDILTNVIVIAAGSMLLTWIGELISEFGIGNGVSLIIFAGIVARVPTIISQLSFTYTPEQLPIYIAFLVAAALITLGVVIVTEAERPIPVSYARRVRGNKVYGGMSTYLPLRLNQAGVIPIIFALSILLFPQMVAGFLAGVGNNIISAIGGFLNAILNNGWIYSILYFLLVFVFTYFYTAVTFDPEQVSKNLQRSGAFIPGVRPGRSTSEYIAKILTRLTLVGALFLGLIAVLPLVMRAITGIASLAIGGTALLIVVSVVIDLVKKIEGQVSVREY